ncbi:hypothetical protein G9A89_002210 [Geosiphon pyriformis]|nr:hypothetical protein G9A89_002210 [Geosiphon pyriformis]
MVKSLINFDRNHPNQLMFSFAPATLLTKMSKFRMFIFLTAHKLTSRKRRQIGKVVDGNHLVTAAEIKALKEMQPDLEVGK